MVSNYIRAIYMLAETGKESGILFERLSDSACAENSFEDQLRSQIKGSGFAPELPRHG